MSDSPIPRDHLRACAEHGVVSPNDTSGGDCPCCATGVEPRPNAVADKKFNHMDLRWQINPGTMTDLLPLLVMDAERVGAGPVYVAVAEISVEQVRGAAGWTDQERWWNVAVVETGNGARKVIKHEEDAQEIIEEISETGGYLGPETVNKHQLTPKAWDGVPDIYAKDIDYEQPDDSTLLIHMDGFPSDNAYSEARQEIGQLAEGANLNVTTVEAGGKFSSATIKVSDDA